MISHKPEWTCFIQVQGTLGLPKWWVGKVVNVHLLMANLINLCKKKNGQSTPRCPVRVEGIFSLLCQDLSFNLIALFWAFNFHYVSLANSLRLDLSTQLSGSVEMLHCKSRSDRLHGMPWKRRSQRNFCDDALFPGNEIAKVRQVLRGWPISHISLQSDGL